MARYDPEEGVHPEGTGIGTMKRARIAIPLTCDDCPERAKFLDELSRRKKREPFTWRQYFPEIKDPQE